MPTTKTLTQLIADVRRQADIEYATDRHPDADITLHLNEGVSELVDLFVAQKGWPWAGKTYLGYGTVTASNGSSATVSFTGVPTSDYSIKIVITTGGDRGTAVFKWSINGGASYTTGVTTAATVTLGNTGIVANFGTVGGTDYTIDDYYTALTAPGITCYSGQRCYDLPSDFYKIHSVLATASGSTSPFSLMELPAKEEAFWRDTTIAPTGTPMYYQILNSRGGACQLNLYPIPTANSTIRVNYYYLPTELSSGSDTLDTLNQWHPYVVTYAAIKAATKDADWSRVGALKEELVRLSKRIESLCSTRSADAPQIQNTRAMGIHRNLRFMRF